MQAQSRRTILEHMTVGLQEVVSENVNQKWLETVPFFRGMQVPDGRQIVQPVEKRFLSKVACALAGGVFAPFVRFADCRDFAAAFAFARSTRIFSSCMLAIPSVNWRGSPPSFVTQYFEISSAPKKYQIKTVAIV